MAAKKKGGSKRSAGKSTARRSGAKRGAKRAGDQKESSAGLVRNPPQPLIQVLES